MPTSVAQWESFIRRKLDAGEIRTGRGGGVPRDRMRDYEGGSSAEAKRAWQNVNRELKDVKRGAKR
jgi:hypothetical protein